MRKGGVPWDVCDARTVRISVRSSNLASGGEFSILYGSPFPRTAGENPCRATLQLGQWDSQSIGNRVPNVVRSSQPDHEVPEGPVGTVHCEEFLGGLLKSYHRAAA